MHVMNDQAPADDSGIFELAPEEVVKPVKRWISPGEVAKQEKTLLCPECSYDLRGLRSDRCPECGKMLTQSAVRQAENKRDGVKDSNWFDGRALSLAAVGLATGGTVWWFAYGGLGIPAFGAYFLFTVVIGWLTFFGCSVMWIGFDQPLRKTVVQTVGAFGVYAGVAAAFALLPVPGIVGFFVSAVVLIWMLSELLDIDFQDAAMIALLVGAMKTVFYMWVLAAFLA